MKFKLSSLFLHAPDDNARGSGKPSPFHAPPKPGELTTLTTGVRQPESPQNDPALSLLETLQAVKDKQHGSSGAATTEKNIDDISGVQAEKNSLQRLMSTQILTIGGASLILVLSLWSMFHLARRASEGISTETIDAKNQEADARTADRAESAPPPPAEQPAAFTPPAANSAGVARPQFKVEGGSLRSGSGPNALAEKERLAREEKEREQRERQREEEDKQERERQLRELEGRDQSGENSESPPSNGAEVAAPPPEDGSQPQPISD